MNKLIVGAAVAVLAMGATAAGVVAKEKSKTTFFITSVGPGKGGDLGGLKGADAWCQKLATQAGAGDHAWHAYLSATDAKGKAINARDRIGKGPWFNAKGVQVASSVAARPRSTQLAAPLTTNASRPAGPPSWPRSKTNCAGDAASDRSASIGCGSRAPALWR